MTARRADDFPRPREPQEERDLVVAFQAGKPEAYAEIYDLYLPRARGICRRMLGDEHDAQEACQEVFLRVFQGLARFNGRYQLGAWIARIATNHCLDVLRARTRRPGDTASYEELEDAPEPVPNSLDPEVVYIRKAEGRRVRRVLNSLPPLYRAAIVLRDFEGLSYAEISDILGITESRLKALLHRARKGFKRSWPTEAVQLLVPARFLERVRKVDAEPHGHAPHAPHVPPTPATTQVAEVVSSATPFVSSCVGALQQCGAAMTERVASLVTVALVGTASVSVAAGLPSPATTEPSGRPVPVTSPTAGTERRTPAPRAATRAPAEKVAAETAPAAEPTPTPSPTPEGSPSPTPSPAPTTGDGTAPTPKPTPSSTPTPPPEPSSYALGMRVDVAPNQEPCDCLRSPASLTEEVRATESGLQGFKQTTEGSALAGGTPHYGMRMEHASPGSSNHRATLLLYSGGGSYSYDLSGRLARRTTTEWGGHVYHYKGSYSNTGRPSHGESMPRAGTYTVEVTVSWRQQRITSVFVDFVESSS